MGRSSQSFQRKTPRYIVEATVLIICEDSKSAKRYLEDAKKHFNVDAEVEVVHLKNTDPIGIVNRAVERMANFDKIYCVVDRDTHGSFDDATKAVASLEKVELVVSYPCFEYWLLLHFEYSRKGYMPAGKDSPGDQMVKALRNIPSMKDYDKGAADGIFEKLLPMLPKAMRHAEKVLKDAECVKEMNPSTRMHELFDEFEAMSFSR